jgi:hypothetical protein
MTLGAATTDAPPGVRSGEPITAVLARVAPVDLDALTLARCEAWLSDAVRVAGWLAATRVRVEELRQLLWFQAQFGGGDDDAVDDGPDDGSPASGAAPPNGEPGNNDPAREPAPPARPVSAREKARQAKLRRGFDLLGSFEGLLETGRVTVDHVLALEGVRNRRQAREHEAAIAAAALAHTAEGFVAWLRTWDAETDLGLGRDLAARLHERRSLRLFDRTGDLGEMRGALPPEVFDALKRTLESIDAELRRAPGADLTATHPQRMADALVEMMHRANTGAGEGSLRTAVVVLIQLRDLLDGTGHGTTVDGTPIDIERVRALAAEGHILPLVLGVNGVPLELGRAQRYATDHQWLALLARDRGCALCDAPLGPLDAHHLHPWHEGGCTDIACMCLLCRRCHRRAHLERLTLTVDTDGRVTVTAPDGTPVTRAGPTAQPRAA